MNDLGITTEIIVTLLALGVGGTLLYILLSTDSKKFGFWGGFISDFIMAICGVIIVWMWFIK